MGPLEPARNNPPGWADRFLEWYCNPELVEEIQGDLYERYQEKVRQRGIRSARRWYVLNVILFINKYTLSRKDHSYTRLNSIGMYKSFLKTGLRNAFKHKWPTLINTAGLALAIGSTLVVYVFMEDTFHNDSMHENLDDIYVLEKTLQKDDGHQKYCGVPVPLGPELEAAFPAVEHTVRLTHHGGTFQYEDQAFQEWVTFVDPAFFDVFSFPLLHGEARSFTERNAIFLSESLAEKYFGRKNPVGEELKIRFSENGENYDAAFTVRGVVKKLSMNSSFFFNLLIPFDRQMELGKAGLSDWKDGTSATFVQLSAGTRPETVGAQLAPLVAKANADVTAWPVTALGLQPLGKIKRLAQQYEDNMFNSSHFIANAMLLTISIILILLVCFNYMNTTIATAVTRLKEISMRKVMGSNRRQIVFQFLAENSVVCAIGLILGLVLARTVFFDLVDGLIAQPFIETLSFSVNGSFCLFLALLFLVIILGGSAYPALYVSKLQPIDIMQDKVKMTSRNRFRKILLGLQFFLTFIMIFTTLAFAGKIRKMKSMDWGYQPEANMVLRIDGETQFRRFDQEVSTIPEIRQVTGGKHRLGDGSEQVSVFTDGQQFDIEGITVGPDHFEALRIPLAEGRYPDAEKTSAHLNSIMVNEEFRKKLGWASAIGQIIKIEDQSYTVIGELANFRHQDFFRTVQPMVYRFCTEDEYQFMTLHLENADYGVITPKLDAAWKKTFPGHSFEYFYQDEVFSEYFRGMETIISVLSSSSLMAVFISAIGLFGLIMLVTASRMKEISIRKVLGAGLVDVGKLLSREFLWPLLTAFVVGAPLSYLLVKSMFQQLAPDSPEIGFLPMLLTVLGMLLLALLSVSGHIYKASGVNPMKHLRK